MTDRKPFVRVPVDMGEEMRQTVIDMGIFDKEHRIISEDGFLYIPLTHYDEEVQRRLNSAEVEVGERDFETTVEGPRSLTEALQDKMSAKALEHLPRAYDLIGDIAVLEIPDEIQEYSNAIGEAFHQIHPNFSTVLAKRGAISGTKRVREYQYLHGEEKTHTVHTEYGFRIAVDLARAYFSPRLLQEHHRVAQQVEPGATVIDMFTGVGPFAIHIAGTCECTVYAIDINPDAIALLEESISMNRLKGEIFPVVADASEYVSQNFDKNVDRIIMNHPSGAAEFVGDACAAIREGGILHYYDFLGGEDAESVLETKIQRLVREADREIALIDKMRRVRDSAPYEYQMVADIVIH
ncbi:class I SAM-dependent methyltransferase family protein [Candidatus Thorarchaeota archaeon]|nr:MAG: class I SAM-dependent methyltransferase family protein [Candidatus Thorarchaeota archaeon]